ncbi:MAG: DUF1549 domain-containing protein [Planctomycetales bacterium]|nr:DUF1549 domain-containing protein [Planctomycetales bacterium]
MNCIFDCVVSHAADAQPAAVINQQLSARWKRDHIQPADRCSDRDFVRRVYLDLAGRIPTVQETTEFLNDGRDDRRNRLIDTLLASEDHVQHFADLFDALLMGRTDDSKYAERVKHGWRDYLETAFRENRPWNDVAAEILLARPDDKTQRGAVWFLYERNNQHQAIAESIAPAFFGIRIECAQCHDHMMVDEIKQEHYWGLVAFFNRSKNENTPNGPRVAESAIGGFSEFANLTGESSPNRLAFLQTETIDERRPEKDEKQADSDELYVPASVSDDPRVPKFSRREQFVTNVLQDHPLLARSMVNRLWAILMGRGIVHPYDEIDSIHPPSHPELLDWLSEDFANNGFDVRRLTGMIARSDAYQLDSKRPDDVNDPSTFAWYLERPLTAEQMARSIQLAMRGTFQNDATVVSSFRAQFLDVLPDQVEVPIADALYFSNNEKLIGYIRESKAEGQLMQQLIGEASHRSRANRLIETLFGREATKDEIKAIVKYLKQRQDRMPDAIEQVVWSLLAGAEFRFNH